MKIFKFGGTSVSSRDSLYKIYDIINDYDKKKESFVIIVSALQGITNSLTTAVDMAHKKNKTYMSAFRYIVQSHDQFVKSIFNTEDLTILKKQITLLNNELDRSLNILYKGAPNLTKQQDNILALGERYTAIIIAFFLKSKGVMIDFLDARELIRTDDTYSDAVVDVNLTTTNIADYFEKDGGSKILSGFIGATSQGVTTTLGRGGSDYTATLFGVALHADCVMKWTDVNGILSGDPKAVKNAISLDKVTFNELSSLTKWGTNVLVHPKAIFPLMENNIPFFIKNTFNDKFNGTKVSKSSDSQTKIISRINNCCIVRLNMDNEAMNNVIRLTKKNLNCLPVETDNETYKYYVLSKKDVWLSVDILRRNNALSSTFLKGAKIIKEGISMVTLISETMNIVNELRSIKLILNENSIKIISSKRSSYSLTLVVESAYVKRVISLLHERFYPISAVTSSNVTENRVDLPFYS